ncbi:MAG: hypothetical protein ACTSRZ_19370 [Promethearchaeota archaeon]
MKEQEGLKKVVSEDPRRLGLEFRRWPLKRIRWFIKKVWSVVFFELSVPSIEASWI